MTRRWFIGGMASVLALPRQSLAAVSDNGTLELLVQVGEVWDRVFGGTAVEKLFVYGIFSPVSYSGVRVCDRMVEVVLGK